MTGVCESCGATTNGNVQCWRCRTHPSLPVGYIVPSRRGTCSRCGKVIQISHTSAAEPVCNLCRRRSWPVFVCPACGREFTRSRHMVVNDHPCCSRQCAAKVRFRDHVPANRASYYLAKSRARRLRYAQTWDGITDEEILDRDGWRCQIPGCKRRPIRRDLKHPHPRSKSVDHIVPISHGGDDTAVNKRAAHLGCNMARGNTVGFEQMALFGVIREPPLMTVTATGKRTVQAPERWPSCPVFIQDCAHCGKPFTARTVAVKYCSDACRRRPVCGVKSCRRCGQQFSVIRGGRKRLYCSDSCRNLAYQQRKAAAA